MPALNDDGRAPAVAALPTSPVARLRQANRPSQGIRNPARLTLRRRSRATVLTVLHLPRARWGLLRPDSHQYVEGGTWLPALCGHRAARGTITRRGRSSAADTSLPCRLGARRPSGVIPRRTSMAPLPGRLPRVWRSSAIRARISASQACGSTLLSLAATMSVYIAAARMEQTCNDPNRTAAPSRPRLGSLRCACSRTRAVLREIHLPERFFAQCSNPGMPALHGPPGRSRLVA